MTLRGLLLCIALAMGCLGLGAAGTDCELPEQGTPVAATTAVKGLSELRAEAAALDFTSQLAASSTYQPADEQYRNYVGSAQFMLATLGRSAAPASVELRITPGGQPASFQGCLLQAHRMAVLRGRLPASGLDLFESLSDAAGLAAFLRLPRSEQFEACALGINPLTGRFYADLSQASCEPGGLRIWQAERSQQPAAGVTETVECSGTLYRYQLLDDYFCIEQQ